MIDMKFEGYYIDNGVSKSIRIVDKPSKEYILSKLNELNANCRGTVMIENALAKEDGKHPTIPLLRWHPEMR